MKRSNNLRLVIGNKNYSSWSLRAWLLLAAHELPFEEIRVQLSTENTAAELARYSKAGRVPVLLDGDLLIWDSMAICEYISEKYLNGTGWPEDIDLRNTGRSAVAEMHSGFETLRSSMPMNCRASKRRVTIDRALAADIARIDELWCSLLGSRSDSTPWLLGRFSIADCAFAPVASRFMTYGVELSDPARNYRDAILSHPAMQRWSEAARAETQVISLEEKGMAGA